MTEIKKETVTQSESAAIVKQDSAIPAPTGWGNDWKLAVIFAKSDLAPKDFRGKPENTFIAIQLGNEIGLKPIQAVQNIAVINGRPCVWGDAALALVQANSSFEYIKETPPTGPKDEDFAECILKRKNQPEVMRRFSWADAKRAGLLAKEGTWKTYPKRMLQMRARGFCLRDGAADILKGIAIREEVEDYEVTVEQPPPQDLMPKRASEAVPPTPEVAEAPPSESPTKQMEFAPEFEGYVPPKEGQGE